MKADLKKSSIKKSAILEEDDFFEAEDIGHGDEFMAVLPWKGQIREPTGWKKPQANQNKAPAIKMELDWIHGYRSRDSRNNIGVLIDGSIAYHAAAVGVGYDPANHT